MSWLLATVDGGGAGAGVSVRVEASVAVLVSTDSVVWGIALSSAEVGIVEGAGAGVEVEVGLEFGVESAQGVVSAGVTMFPIVFLSFMGVPLGLLGGGWAGSVGSDLRMVLLSFVAGLKK